MKCLSDDFKNGLKEPWMKLYLRGCAISMGLYIILLLASVTLLRNRDLGIWQIPVGLIPAVPIAYLVWIYKQSLGLMDEFTRHIHICAILFAAALTTVVSVFISFFENAGLPPFTFHVWTLMCLSWGLALVYNYYKYR